MRAWLLCEIVCVRDIREDSRERRCLISTSTHCYIFIIKQRKRSWAFINSTIITCGGRVQNRLTPKRNRKKKLSVWASSITSYLWWSLQQEAAVLPVSYMTLDGRFFFSSIWDVCWVYFKIAWQVNLQRCGMPSTRNPQPKHWMTFIGQPPTALVFLTYHDKVQLSSINMTSNLLI